jgi:hypothetical protein
MFPSNFCYLPKANTGLLLIVNAVGVLVMVSHTAPQGLTP